MRKSPLIRLLFGFVVMAGLIVSLHLCRSSLPGIVGQVIRHNIDHEIEANAYFYSDLGDISAFLDDEKGKYGRKSLELELSH